MRLTVHIGTTKTGSTSIQAFLQLNRAILHRAGVLVPASLGRPHHLRAVLSSLPYRASPDLARFAGIATPEEHTVYCAETLQAYAAERRGATQISDVIITSEHLHSRLEKTASIQAFHDQFCADYQNCRIVVYVRPQLDHAVSLYSTMLRHGFDGTLDDFLTSRSAPRFQPYFDISAVIDRWAAVFGAEALVVRPYNALSREGGGVIADFCRLLGQDPAMPGLVIPPPKNLSISTHGQELLRSLNAGPALDPKQRYAIVSWLEQHASGTGEPPSLEAARRFQAQFDAGNAAVIARYFPDHPDYLEPRWPRA